MSADPAVVIASGLESRVARIESDVAHLTSDVRDIKVDVRAVNERLTLMALKSDVDRQFDRVDARFERMEQNSKALADKVDRYFLLLFGGVVVGVVGKLTQVLFFP